MAKKEIEVRVVKHTSFLDDLYCVEWRIHRKFISNSKWKRMECVIYNGIKTTNQQPVLLSYEDAIKWADELKQNPELIREHKKEQLKLYQEVKEKFENKNKK
jgi:phage terminase small subunit